ncbi:hypothetical protein QAD02_010197 [Eretmocerus hayati]|uniref:Uncharacterized protein n=1 Tax=Eretmocerus hayati TaxID=131215 RepID=A0ACC2NBV2_9HYME|nr:hypothetical protein QAD02_010197 [Eretmocerus hayati]
MTSNASNRHAAAPVRQLSLQQPIPSNRRQQHQQHIRRQRSTEDERLYASSMASSRNRFPSTELHHGYSPKQDKPKVRMAWTESSTGKQRNESGVEIVARQIPTNKFSRPATGRGSRGLMTRCPLAEKATILYSRQELAERLRLAWKQRQETKSNIDIFLAHNTVEERSDSRLSSITNQTASPTPRVSREGPSQRQCQEASTERKGDAGVPDAIDKPQYKSWFSNSVGGSSTIGVTKDEALQTEITEDDDRSKNERVGCEKLTMEKKSISINCNDWNTPITIEITNDRKSESKILEKILDSYNPVEEQLGCFQSKQTENFDLIPISKEPDYSQASLRRASYQSRLNKAFNDPVIEKPLLPKTTSRVNLTNHVEPTQKLRRTGSAPSQRGPPQTTSDNSTQETLIEPERRVMSANKEQKGPSNNVRVVKSATLTKKRSKSGKKRQSSMEELSSNTNGGKTTKGCKSQVVMEAKRPELVTMVSLVSSADSESEIDENSPKDDKLIRELRNKLPTTPIIKTSLNPGIRKPFKSVSFQQDYSFDYESPRGDHLQARLVALSKTEITSSSVPNQEKDIIVKGTCRDSYSDIGRTEPAGPSEREKRCLAVPIDDDSHDKKPKLLRCRSATIAPCVVRNMLQCNQKSSNVPEVLTNASEIDVEPRLPKEHCIANLDSACPAPMASATNNDAYR